MLLSILRMGTTEKLVYNLTGKSRPTNLLANLCSPVSASLRVLLHLTPPLLLLCPALLPARGCQNIPSPLGSPMSSLLPAPWSRTFNGPIKEQWIVIVVWGNPDLPGLPVYPPLRGGGHSTAGLMGIHLEAVVWHPHMPAPPFVAPAPCRPPTPPPVLAALDSAPCPM